MPMFHLQCNGTSNLFNTKSMFTLAKQRLHSIQVRIFENIHSTTFLAKNPTNKAIVGISSYNLTPFQAAYYFNKIQCFCFEEQILHPGEEIELPVFFYIDPDYANDPALEHLDSILLSYTFFEVSFKHFLISIFVSRPRTI